MADTSNDTRWWYDPKSKRLEKITDRNQHHTSTIMDDPQKFGIKKLEVPPRANRQWAPKILQQAFENGWVRVRENYMPIYGGTVVMVQGKTLRDIQAATKAWQRQQGDIARLVIDASQNNTEATLQGEQIRTFAKTGRITQSKLSGFREFAEEPEDTIVVSESMFRRQKKSHTPTYFSVGHNTQSTLWYYRNNKYHEMPVSKVSTHEDIHDMWVDGEEALLMGRIDPNMKTISLVPNLRHSISKGVLHNARKIAITELKRRYPKYAILSFEKLGNPHYIREETDERQDLLTRWRKLVNMSAGEIKAFLDSDEGKKAGLSRKEAKNAGSGGGKITSGRDSARAAIRLKETPPSKWTDNDWKWAAKQVSFISRMKGNSGGLQNDKGEKSRKHLSLLVWGHNPNK